MIQEEKEKEQQGTREDAVKKERESKQRKHKNKGESSRGKERKTGKDVRVQATRREEAAHTARGEL